MKRLGILEIAAYIIWHREHGDPFLLRNAVRKEEKSRGTLITPSVIYGIGENSPLFFRDKNFQIPHIHEVKRPTSTLSNRPWEQSGYSASYELRHQLSSVW